MENDPPAQPTKPAWTERLLARLSRETTSGRFIPQIDGLRSVAVLSVFFFHLDAQMEVVRATDPLNQGVLSIVRRGYLGVPIFFAISAFIVGLPFARYWLTGADGVNVGRFYLRRLTRLEPPYIINLLFLWLVGGLLGRWLLTEKIPGLLASLTYQHNLLFGYFSTVNSVTWSLEIEFQFYLLAPLLSWVFAVRSAGWRRAIIVGVALVFILFRELENRRVELSLLGQIEYFAAGFLLLDVYLTRWKSGPPGRLGWDLAGLMAWPAFFLASRIGPTEIRQLVLFALLLLALLGSLGGGVLSRIFGNRWVCTFGGMCYSFYLYHQWLLVATTPALERWMGGIGPYWAELLIQTAVQLPLVTVISALLFVWVEKPFMRRDWPQRFLAWWKARWRTDPS